LAQKQAGKNIKKKVFRIVLNLALVILSLPLAFTFLFSDPMVQTQSARMLTNMLTSQIGHEVRIERMKINFRTGVSLYGLAFHDHRGETLLAVNALHAKPIFGELGLLGLRFRSLTLDGVAFRYARYKEDKDFSLIMILDRFSLRDTTSVKPKTKTGSGFKLKSRVVELKDAVFHFYDEHRKEENTTGMDYADIRFEKINLYSRKFSMVDDSLSLIIDSLSTVEQSGFTVKKITSDFSIARSGLVAAGTRIELPGSIIDVDLEFKNKSYKTFAYFIDSVYMYGYIRPSTIDMSEIGVFSDNLIAMKNNVGITGEVWGPIRDLRGKDLRAHYGENTRIHCDGRIIGLPDFFTSHIDATIHQFSTTGCDLRAFRFPEEDMELDYTEEFDCRQVVTANGVFKGSYYDFKTNLTVSGPVGSVDADIAFTMRQKDTLYFKAHLRGDTVNIAKITHQEEILGKANFDLNINGNGNSTEDLYVSASGLLRSFDLLDYRYSRMRFNGSYYRDTLRGIARFGDHNLMMDARGYLSLTEPPSIALSTKIKKANLDRIGLWPDSKLIVSGSADFRMKGFDMNTTLVSAKLENAKLDFNGDIYSVKYARLEKTLDENQRNLITLNSDIADLNLSGKYRIMELPSQIIKALTSYYHFTDAKYEEEYVEGEYADLNLEFKKTNLIEEQFLPGIEIETPLLVEGSFGNDDNMIMLKSNPGKVIFKGIELRDNQVSLDAQRGTLNFFYHIDDLIVKDSTADDKSVFGMEDFRFDLTSANDSISYSINWENTDSFFRNDADILGYMATTGKSSRYRVQRSDIYINDTLWTIDPKNLIVVDSTGLYFNDVDIYGGSSMMSLSGKLPVMENDLMKLTFNDWDLSNLDLVLQAYNADLDGIANGDLEVEIVGDNPAIISNLKIDSLFLNQRYLGTAQLLNTWDNADKSIFVKSEVVRKGDAGKGVVLSLNGYYYPFRLEDAIDLDIKFNRLNLQAIEPMVADFVSYLEGQASGDLKLSGTENAPVITGTIDMKRTSLRVNYTNVTYSFSNKINFREREISFNEVMIFDTLGNFATVNGSLRHENFKKSTFDVDITTDKLLFFNTTSRMNDLYYGTAITSGDIKVRGNPQNILLNMNVKSQPGTDVTLPLDYTLEISDKDYILFVDHDEDTTSMEEELEGKARQEEFAYAINLGLGIQRDARIRIFLPSSMGRIESRGRGDLFMHANSTGDFTLRGDYVVESGIFNFTLANLVNKRFDLVRGGRIVWTGDPYTANLNIKGLYRVRTSLSSLGITLSDEMEFKNKVNVNCYVILRNQLMNPDIKFEIDFPNADQETKRLIYAELDTTNAAVMNEQMLSLLVLGSFSASNASNISLASSYYSVMTNQLSNMLSRLSDDFDIGINYKPGEQVSQEEFEVALSTQLLDDRLIIESQVGMTYDRAEQNASNIVGDVDVGYKLTPDGRWILTAFNRSNVNTWETQGLERVAPYTQGVGVAFRKDFNHISQLFKRTRPRKHEKATRQEEEVEEAEEEIENM
jgi:hypothetical protein